MTGVRPGQPRLVEGRLPSAVKPILLCCLVAVVVLSPWLHIPRLTANLMTTICIYGIASSGLNLMFGYTGMLSLGGGIFVGISGYTCAMALQDGHWPIGAALAAAIVFTLVIAFLLGFVLVRLSGYYFGVATLGLALAFYSLMFALPGAGGGSGLTIVPRVKIGPFRISTADRWYVTAVILTAVMTLLLSWLVAGKRGRLLRMVRHDELAAEVLGVPVFWTKLLVFTLGALFAAISGVLLFLSNGLINPDSVSPLTSVQLLVLVVIGGAGYRVGALIGAFVIIWVQALFSASGSYELVTYGAVLLAVVFNFQSGLEGVLSNLWHKLAGRPTARLADDAVSLSKEVDRPALTRGLEVRSVRRRFGGVLAVDDVSIDVPIGRVTALVGANGAGKTTLVNLISGVEPLDQGSVLLDGEAIGHLTPAQRTRRGLVRTFQVPRLIGELSVAENIAIGHEASGRPLLRRRPSDEYAQLVRAHAALEGLGLGHLSERLAGSLGTGERKYVEVARSVFSGASVMLLDEPAVGLSPAEVEQLRSWLENIREAGTAVLVIDHNVDFIYDLADDVYSMDAGRIVSHGTAEEFRMPTLRPDSTAFSAGRPEANWFDPSVGGTGE